MNTQISRFIPDQDGDMPFHICLSGLRGRTAVRTVSIAHDSKTANHENIQTWGLPDGAFVRLGKGVMGGSDRAIAFSPEGKHLAVASGIGIWIYDVETTHELSLAEWRTCNLN